MTYNVFGGTLNLTLTQSIERGRLRLRTRPKAVLEGAREGVARN